MGSHIPIVKNVNNVSPKQVLLASRKVWRNAQYSRRECVAISGISASVFHCMKFFLVRIFRIQPKYEKIRTRKNSVFAHFSFSVFINDSLCPYKKHGTNANNCGTKKLFSIFTVTGTVKLKLKLRQQGTYRAITYIDDLKDLFPDECFILS